MDVTPGTRIKVKYKSGLVKELIGDLYLFDTYKSIEDPDSIALEGTILENLDDADEEFGIVVRLDPVSVNCIIDLGIAYFNKNELEII